MYYCTACSRFVNRLMLKRENFPHEEKELRPACLSTTCTESDSLLGHNQMCMTVNICKF